MLKTVPNETETKVNGVELTRGQRGLVRESFLFRDVPEEGLDFCLARSEAESAGRGAALYTPARFRRCLGLVLSGRVRVTRGDLLVSVLERGDWFGAAALFNDREEYPSTLTALAECQVLFLPQDTVAQLMDRWPRAGANYVRYLSGRICFLSDRLNSLAAGTAEEKVEQFLLRSADADGRVTLSATAIAQALGLGRASVYRAFDRLEEREVIFRTGKEIRVKRTQI